MINNINEKKCNNACTSCQACAAICPVSAISVELDDNGFYRPQITDSKCLNCGKCKTVCYKFDADVKKSDKYINIYSCKAQDDKLLKNVTSGGIAYLLANKAICEGYKVIGVTYDFKKNIAVSKISDCNIEEFRGSKYIQAYTAEAFSEALKNKTDKYMVFGTPCQIYALNKAVNQMGVSENFVFVDLFCHGCPTMLLWNKCIEKIRNNINEDSFDKVEFRSKHRGWHEFSMYFEKNGKKFVTNNEFDAFYSLFFSDMLLNDACSECKLRSSLHYTDIRLGDFWAYRYDTDKQGVSAVAAVTPKGEHWLKKLPCDVFLAEHTLQEVIKNQSYDKVYSVNKENRSILFDKLKSNMNVDDINKVYISMLSKKTRLKLFCKKITYLLPQDVRYSFRKYFHGRS